MLVDLIHNLPSDYILMLLHGSVKLLSLIDGHYLAEVTWQRVRGGQWVERPFPTNFYGMVAPFEFLSSVPQDTRDSLRNLKDLAHP